MPTMAVQTRINRSHAMSAKRVKIVEPARLLGKIDSNGSTHRSRQRRVREQRRQRSSCCKSAWSFDRVCSSPTRRRSCPVSVWPRKRWNSRRCSRRLGQCIETFRTGPSRRRSNWRKSTATSSSCWACETGPRTTPCDPDAIAWNSAGARDTKGNHSL